jgi:glyoxylase-like metal-dependent hydrolase (beta-lactamase superfamily II)
VFSQLDLERNLSQLYPGVWRLVAPNASAMTGPGTNTYLVGREQVVIIDPGPQNPSHLANILEALQTLLASVQAIIVTHPHSDHQGCADLLAKQLQAPLLRFDQPLQHGDKIEVADKTLLVQHTPGHIYAHICLWDIKRRLLFAGDLVAGQGTVLIIPPDGDMAAYLASLRAMLALAPAAILPGHGPVIENAPALLQSYIDHRLARENQVLYWLSQGVTTAEAIAAKIYADRPEVLNIAPLQIEAHLEKLRREGRA